MYYGWVLVWALGITTVVSYGTTQYLFQVLVVPIQHDFGWSRAQISGAYSLTFVSAGLIGLVSGRIVDRRGARLLMALGSAVAGLALIGLSQVHQLWQLYGLWSGCIAIANALTFYPTTFIVITNWFVRRRGSALALLTLLGGLASPIFIPLAGVLVPRLGWRETVVVFGLVQLLVALPIHLLAVRRRPEDMGLLPDGEPGGAVEPEPIRGAVMGEAARGLPFWTLTISAALGGLAHAVLLTHQVAYMIGRGYDPVFAASAAGLLGVASLPGRYIINRVSERISPQSLLAVCCVVQAAGVALLALASSAVILWAFVVAYGIGFGAVSPLRASTMADQFGRRAFGAITATQGLPVAIAAAIGPVVAGAMYDRLHGYELALWLTSGAFVLAALATWLTPRPPPGSPSSLPEPVPTVA
jgi:MFS family permease